MYVYIHESFTGGQNSKDDQNRMWSSLAWVAEYGSTEQEMEMGSRICPQTLQRKYADMIYVPSVTLVVFLHYLQNNRLLRREYSRKRNLIWKMKLVQNMQSHQKKYCICSFKIPSSRSHVHLRCTRSNKTKQKVISIKRTYIHLAAN